MEELKDMAVNQAPTPEQNIVETPQEQPQPIAQADGNNQKPTLYTKEQVVNFMKQRVDRSHKSFYDRYNVASLEELDALFDKTKQYDTMNSEYSKIMLQNAELSQMNAFLRNNIEPNRYDDIKAYFKGTNTEFSEDALLQAIATHPEWVKQPLHAGTVQTTIKTLGVEAKPTSATESEDEKMKRIFGI